MLPQIQYNSITIKIPTTGIEHEFRRMNGYDEEILLQAKEENNKDDHYTAVKQVIKACGNDINLNDLSIVDIEWIFLKLRQNSVDETATFSILDREDNEYYPLTINLEEVTIKYPEKVSDTVEVSSASPKTIFTMKYPNASLYTKAILKPEEVKNNSDEIISKCIDKISIGEGIFIASSLTEDELKGFVKTLPMSARNKALEFIFSAPSLFYETTYKNSKNEEKKIVLSTLEDFFSF